MAIFGKSESVEKEMQKVENEAISSIIDKSMTIKGEVFFKGKTRIDGAVDGNIEGEHLILSETGKVTGDIKVTSFNCYGILEGNVEADMLTARKNCYIRGKLSAKNLTVEPGAAIEGEIKTTIKEMELAATGTPPPPRLGDSAPE
jgi:cytoskeletal protein CcmA (bactofilin family)